MLPIENHKKQKVSIFKFVVSILAFIFVSISIILLFLYPFASKEKTDYFVGENPILFKGEQSGNAIMEGETIYVPLSFMKERIDDQLFYDEKSNSIIITTKNKVVQMPTESLTYFVNEVPVELQLPALKNKDGNLYVSLELLESYYDIEYNILPNSTAIEILLKDKTITHGIITGSPFKEEMFRLRVAPNLQSPYTSEVKENEKVTIEGEENNYYFVRKEDGTAGYIKGKFIKVGESETIVVQSQEDEKEKIIAPDLLDSPIQLTWEAVYSKNPDPLSIPEMPGVNVVSPTWFELTDTSGTVQNLGSLDYVKWAKNRNYQVWALFSNGFDPDLTHEALKHFDTRQNIIRQLLHYSQMYNLDGINIDIENVREEDGPLVTQFIREATPYFHEAGLLVSMDITFIAKGNWSAFYEREKLAKTVDYLIVMAYDEHWGTSPKAGSVASLPWVENNLEKLLKVVPNDKLILGVPLYTRLWEEKDTGEVTSKSMSMAAAKQWLEENNITPQYDPISGQNYAEYRDENNQLTYRIWLEDELSLKKRVELVDKYGLKGVASWSRYFADNTAWTALQLNNQHFVQKK